MWLTSTDIASTPGGQAGMRRSQPLQWSTSIVTVPRLLIIFVPVVASGMRRAPLPCGVRVRGEQVPARAQRAFVGFDVLRAVRRGCPPPPPLDEGVETDDAGGARVRAEHHHRSAERVAEVGRDVGRAHPDHLYRRGDL